MRKYFLLIIFFVLVFALALFLRSRALLIIPSSSQTISVVASFYPLAEFAQAVGGDLVNIETITPSGIEPHDFEPSPQDVAKMYHAELFVYNGGAIDAWAQRLQADLEKKDVRVLEMKSLMTNLLLVNEEQELFDEHFWLSPTHAEIMVQAISDALVLIDPEHTTIYEENTNKQLAKFRALDAEYRQTLASCEKPIVITSHAAFGYIARDYGFTMLSIAGLSPEEEPSAQTLSDLATLAKKNNVSVVFFEELVSPELAETLANEIGAKTQVFYPLEGLSAEQQAAGEDYFSLMRKNLLSLQNAMQCSVE